MAYIQTKYVVADQSGSYNPQRVVSGLFDALEDMGFILHDTIDTYEKVYKTQGETEDGIYNYFHIDGNVSSTSIYFKSYGYWDASTSTGTSPSVRFTVSVSASSIYYNVIGNADFCIAYSETDAATFAFGFVFGRIPTTYYNPIATLSASVSAGSNKTLTVDSTTNFYSGFDYIIFDPSNGNVEKINISGVDSSTEMVASAIENAYGLNSLVGISPFHFAFVGNSETNCGYCALSTSSSYSDLRLAPELSSTLNETTPFQTPVLCNVAAQITSQSEVYGNTAFILYGNFEQTGETYPPILYGDADTDDIYAVRSNLPEIGSPSSSSTTQLSDTTKSWATNVFSGKTLIITGGDGQGQVRKITSNTATVLSIIDDFNTSITNSSTYEIVDAAYSIFYGNIMFKINSHDV